MSIGNGLLWIWRGFGWVLSGIWHVTTWLFSHLWDGILWTVCNCWSGLVWFLSTSWEIVKWLGLHSYAMAISMWPILLDNVLAISITVCVLLSVGLLYYVSYKSGYGSVLSFIKNALTNLFKQTSGKAAEVETAKYSSIQEKGKPQSQKQQASINFIVRHCPKCNGELRFPGNLHIRVTCKHCSHAFEVNKGRLGTGNLTR